MVVSHCPEVDTRWKHDDRSFQIRLWSWKHRAICEGILNNRMVAGGLSQAPAATSWAAPKSLSCQKIPGQPREGAFSYWIRESSLLFVRPSWKHLAWLCRLRVTIPDIGHFSPHEYNTKETRTCPIVLGRQHDYLNPSHCRRVAINSKKFTVRWHRDGITASTKTAELSSSNICDAC